MQTKHTPGPWHLLISDKGWHNRFQIERADHACLFSFGDSPFHTDAEADARLIAAAPDMLAALQSILYFIEEGGNGLEATCERVARAAITKVLGKA